MIDAAGTPETVTSRPSLAAGTGWPSSSCRHPSGSPPLYPGSGSSTSPPNGQSNPPSVPASGTEEGADALVIVRAVGGGSAVPVVTDVAAVVAEAVAGAAVEAAAAVVVVAGAPAAVHSAAAASAGAASGAVAADAAVAVSPAAGGLVAGAPESVVMSAGGHFAVEKSVEAHGDETVARESEFVAVVQDGRYRREPVLGPSASGSIPSCWPNSSPAVLDPGGSIVSESCGLPEPVETVGVFVDGCRDGDDGVAAAVAAVAVAAAVAAGPQEILLGRSPAEGDRRPDIAEPAIRSHTDRLRTGGRCPSGLPYGRIQRAALPWASAEP